MKKLETRILKSEIISNVQNVLEIRIFKVYFEFRASGFEFIFSVIFSLLAQLFLVHYQQHQD